VTADMGPFKIGDLIAGKYEIRGLLGKGGHAFVYHAFNTIFEEDVAIKVILNLPHRGQQQFNRAHREAKALRRMNHPHVVSVKDAGEVNGMAYIVMEKLDGMDLRKMIQLVGPLTVFETLLIALQVAKALEAAHAIKVIHRDLKPENIFLLPGNHVKVLDFGIAKVLEGGYPTTQRDLIQGTVAYMSPEQAQGHGVSFASDVFQLFVIIYELIAGIPPCMVGVEEPTAQVLIAIQISKMPPRLKALVPNVPDYVDRMVWRALAKEPWQRYPTSDAARDRQKSVLPGVATEFIAAIEGAIERLRIELPLEQRAIRVVGQTALRDPGDGALPVPDPRTTPIALATSRAAGAQAVRGPADTEVMPKAGPPPSASPARRQIRSSAAAGTRFSALLDASRNAPAPESRPVIRRTEDPASTLQAIRRLFVRAAVIGTAVALPIGVGVWFVRSHSRPVSEVMTTASERPLTPPATGRAPNEAQRLAVPAAPATDVSASGPRAIPEPSPPASPTPTDRARSTPSIAPKTAAKSTADVASMALPSSGLDIPLAPKAPVHSVSKPSAPTPVASAADAKKLKLIF
jgi:eukaryotic-like serine/threonine-protein kinase